MESFLSRFKNALALLAILLVQIVALAAQVERPADGAHADGPRTRLLRLWALALVTPFERGVAWSGRGVGGAWTNYIDLRGEREKNASLERELARLRGERGALAEDAIEARRLRALLGFRQQYVSSTVAAQVIGTSGSDQSRLLTLNKGWRDGLRPDMPVITPDGVVGKLRDVFPGTAQLLLLSDPTAGAGVLLETTRVRAIVRGTPQGRLVIGSLLADARIRPGEHVLTSGGDQVFPRGLAVGTVESIAPDPDHQPYTAILLKPAANLTELEEVLVVTGMAPTLPGSSEEELAQDAAAQSAAQNGASDRSGALPGAHIMNPAIGPGEANAAPPAENSTSLVPHPKPVVHPDRFSPGAAPPAADLMPGAPAPNTAPPSGPNTAPPSAPRSAPAPSAPKPQGP